MTETVSTVPYPHTDFAQSAQYDGWEVSTQEETTGTRTYRIKKTLPEGHTVDLRISNVITPRGVLLGTSAEMDVDYTDGLYSSRTLTEQELALFALGYSHAFIVSLVGTCPECGQYVGSDRLNQVAMTYVACGSCLPIVKGRVETPNWYN